MGHRILRIDYECLLRIIKSLLHGSCAIPAGIEKCSFEIDEGQTCIWTWNRRLEIYRHSEESFCVFNVIGFESVHVPTAAVKSAPRIEIRRRNKQGPKAFRALDLRLQRCDDEFREFLLSSSEVVDPAFVVFGP